MFRVTRFVRIDNFESDVVHPNPHFTVRDHSEKNDFAIWRNGADNRVIGPTDRDNVTRVEKER